MTHDPEKLFRIRRAAAAEERAAQEARAALERIAPTPSDPETGEPLNDDRAAVMSIADWDLTKKATDAAYKAAVGNDKVQRHLLSVLAALRRAEIIP